MKTFLQSRKRIFVFIAVTFGLITSVFPAAPASRFSKLLDIPPRLQWGSNFGYCGEVSMISAGLYYGQYCSQYTARDLASPGVPQQNEDSQLLVGVNDVQAADAMHLKSEEWNYNTQQNSKQFFIWMKKHVLQDHPVIIGLFTNEYLFYGDTNPNAGDEEYDHIVTVTGVGSQVALNGSVVRYIPSDIIHYSDEGLWAPNNIPPYNFSSRFGQFCLSRKAANAKKGPIYSLNNNATNYGIAITGVKDLNNNTIPVRVSTDVNYESPEITEGSNTPPTAMPITLTVTVTIPNQAVSYKLYLYDDFDDVPDSQFNANAGDASATWTIPAASGPTYTTTVNIMSNEVAVFRAVATTAP